MKKLIALVVVINMAFCICLAGDEQGGSSKGNWKETYRNYIENGQGGRFELADVDFNGTPELIHFYAGSNASRVFTVKYGKLYYLKNGTYREASFDKKGVLDEDFEGRFSSHNYASLFLIRNINTNQYSFAFHGFTRNFEISASWLEQLFPINDGVSSRRPYYGEWTCPDYRSNNARVYTFKVSGNPVSTEEYNKATEAFWKIHEVVNYVPSRLELQWHEKASEAEMEAFLNGYQPVSEFKKDKILVINRFIAMKSPNSPIIENGQVLLPFQPIFSRFYVNQIKWDHDQNQIYLKKVGRDSDEMIFPIGKKVMYKNGEEIALDAATKVIDGAVYVSLDTVKKSYGFAVIWNEREKTIFTNYNAEYLDYVRKVGLLEVDKETSDW